MNIESMMINKGKVLVSFFLITLLVSSCISFDRLAKSNYKEVINFSADSLSGFYHNSDSFGKTNLWRVLSNSSLKQDSGKKEIDSNAVIKLEMIRGKYLKAIAYENQKPVAVKLLKGKVQQNYFSPKRSLSVIPLPLIYVEHYEDRIIIGRLTDGNLVIVNGYVQSKMIFLMSAGISYEHIYFFNTLK